MKLTMSIARIVSSSFIFFLEKKNKTRNHILNPIHNELESFLVFTTSSTCVPQFWFSVIKIKSNNTEPILLIHKIILYNITKVHPRPW